MAIDDTTAADHHVPVMRDEVVDLFMDVPEGPYVDATLGAGGHALAIGTALRDRDGHATVLGIDRDPEAIELARRRLADVDGIDFDVAQVRFDHLADEVAMRGWGGVSGVLLDLGVSSMHLDRGGRGFSHRFNAPLDMRMGPDAPRTAAALVADVDARQLATILREYGEERHAGRIARAIVAARPTTTTALADVVAAAMPPGAAARDRGHPARRTFQALRIAVNGELDALRAVLPQAIDVLVPHGVLAVLAYHSLEDRIVKRAFAHAASDCTCPPDLPVCACDKVATVTPLVRKAGRPRPDEVAVNPRASAARLRAVKKLELP